MIVPTAIPEAAPIDRRPTSSVSVTVVTCKESLARAWGGRNWEGGDVKRWEEVGGGGKVVKMWDGCEEVGGGVKRWEGV